MKLLTIIIPCYNAEEYMRHAVDSALLGGDFVEILIVNDGSRDGTERIADEYQQRYPQIIRAIHQQNKGHGGTIMTGLKNASGAYIKVLDADDWLDADSYPLLLSEMQSVTTRGGEADMFISNYVYDKVGAKHKHVVRYTHALPTNRVFGWDEVGRFRKGQYMLMHSVIYRTQLLRDANLNLPEHTFYVDNLYAYTPMRNVRRMYYTDATVYHYSIGREDQSVHEEVMIGRIDQQLLVNRRMFGDVDFAAITNPRMKRYMLSYLEIVTAASASLLIRSGTKENYLKKQRLMEELRLEFPDIWRELRFRFIGMVLSLRGAPGRWVVNCIYAAARAIFKFN
ncbi:MAG: glycosyltransferase [Oscillospiraceae bacterium]|jgi:glycosyltransferase involved in cell wall biosynthesis|nr:glycosyltransferase [Oscillospiraceae bacterium]